MPKVLIEVTQEDIGAGYRGSCNRCPIARAISRVLPTPVSKCSVGSSDVRLYMPGRRTHSHEVGLPHDACVFIEEFDARKPVEPFSFYLDVPDQATGTQPKREGE